MRKYIEIIRLSFKNSITYKLNTITGIFYDMINLFVQVYLWQVIFRDHSVSYVSLDEMIMYQIVGILLAVLYTSDVTWEVGRKVMDGSIALELIRPYNYSFWTFAKSMGNVLNGIIFKCAPVLIISIFVYSFSISISILHAIILIYILVINMLLYWLMHFIIGLLHFELTSAGWFVRILRDTIRIFGGGIIPIWFFPQFLKDISLVMPFQLLYQFPQSLIINKISSLEIILNLAAQAVWVLGLIICGMFLWNRVIKKLTVNGG